MIEFIKLHVQHVIYALADLGYFTEPPKNNQWFIRIDSEMLKSRGFRAAASLYNEIPVIVIPEDLQLPNELNVITHEAIHLAQILKGSMVIISGTGKTNWEGKIYDYVPAEREDYFSSQPWEQEALELEPNVKAKIIERVKASQNS